ncbi:Phosphatidylinositol 3-kinase, partial [Operophtera brumata]
MNEIDDKFYYVYSSSLDHKVEIKIFSTMNEIDDKFYYVYSSSLDHKVEIKIGTLEGKRTKPEYDKLLSDPMLKFSGLYQEGCSDLCVTCQILSDGEPLALPVTTTYNWNEWITLPVHFSDLPRNATLAMTIYDCAGPGKVMVVGGTTISLEQTPGKAPDRGKEQMQRLAKLAKKHRNGHMPKHDLVWKYRYIVQTDSTFLKHTLACSTCRPTSERSLSSWNASTGIDQALSMMQQWAPMDVEDALELLTPRFTHPAALSMMQQWAPMDVEDALELLTPRFTHPAALSMMQQWAPMDVEDALELLTPRFTHPAVRKRGAAGAVHDAAVGAHGRGGRVGAAYASVHAPRRQE